ncbi:general secretion pathway protein B [Vogesella indigofera]|uniref:General secretion pathway protein B n=1 Tax=Vogesella indigofera TaxID=45465 RepID=A0A495B5D2_VOGIN|nr:general secretion pathway protein GspB [Vogesella indigofera]RKQ55424.1 general secretion pathway protein B [Vogesella indigofera]
MSYILDALLKADQERQRHSTPTVHSIHAAQSIQPTPGKPRWRYLLLILLLGSGIAAAGMLFGWQALATIRPATPQAADNSSVALNRNTPQPAEATVAYLPPANSLPLARQSDAELTPLPAPAAPAPSRKENHVAAASKPAAQTTAAPAPAAEATVSRIDNRVFNLRELPAALQKEIGDSVVISGFSSSAEDSERLVIINDRVRRAGDDVVAGMTLESIQADGVILNYKGYRFRSGSF